MNYKEEMLQDELYHRSHKYIRREKTANGWRYYYSGDVTTEKKTYKFADGGSETERSISKKLKNGSKVSVISGFRDRNNKQLLLTFERKKKTPVSKINQGSAITIGKYMLTKFTGEHHTSYGIIKGDMS